MRDDNITLWQSKKLKSHLASLATVWDVYAMNIKTGDVYEYNRAGVKPAFDDAKQVYAGSKDNLVLVAVGETGVKGHMTMAGRHIYGELTGQIDKARNLYGRGYNNLRLAGSLPESETLKFALTTV
jgi:hypothetical protein